MSPGTTPAMNSWPTDADSTRGPSEPTPTLPPVATAKITITIEGGIRMPSAPEVVMTPAPKRLGNPCCTMAGSTIDPMATTVAGDDPAMAAHQAQAIAAG